MNISLYFLGSFLIYILSTAFYYGYLFSQKNKLARIGSATAGVGLIIHTLALILRTFQSGHAPFTNMYESLSFLAWSSVLAYLIVEKKYAFKKAGAFLMLIVIALMALASSPLMSSEAAPLVPALQSYWLWLHVSVTLLGEAFFAVAFVTSILYLYVRSKDKRGTSSPLSAQKLDFISYRAIALGFPLFTLGGLVFGMIWAYKAWGSYWSWDPKETWTLITWFVFALYLHTRIVWRWRGFRSALIAVLGFLTAMFTYFGVNYLITGLHSYT